MYRMALQVYFPEEDCVSVVFKSAAHSDEDAGFEARYHETYLTLFAARHFANLRSRGGDGVAASLAATLTYLDQEDPTTDVRNELGAVQLVSAGKSEGGKGFHGGVSS